MMTKIVDTPTTVHQLRDGLEVWCFGRPFNWSLKQYLEDGTADNRPPLLEIFQKAGVERVYAPNSSTFTGRILPRQQITPLWINGQKVVRGGFREAKWAIPIRPLADGLVLQPDEAIFKTSGDCPTIIAWCEQAGHVIAAHAGLDSLFDRQHALSGERSRERPSVVDEIMWHFAPWSGELRVIVVCGIGADQFAFDVKNHPRATKNEVLLKHLLHRADGDGAVYINKTSGRGTVDLSSLIRNQFVRRHKIGLAHEGYQRVVQDRVNTYDDTDYDRDSDWRWWSHRRWVDQGKQGPDGRNGILVIRRS